MKHVAPLLSAILLLVSLVPAAHAKLSASGAAEASFVASATGGIKVRGVTSELRLDDRQGSIVVVVPLASLKTGIALRDRHMREKYLETDKFPNAELVIPRSAITFPADGAAVSQNATGSLSLHGTTRPTPFNYAARRDGSTYLVNGAMSVNLKDFGIKPPSFMGVTVGNAVEVRVRFQASDSP